MRVIKTYYLPKEEKWSLYIDGKDYSHLLPTGFTPNTQCFNSYSGEIFGLPFSSWLDRNGWVWNAPALPGEIYAAFQIEEQSIYPV